MKNNFSSKLFGVLLRFSLTFGNIIAIGFLISISISKFYWGYFFNAPELPKQVKEFEKIRSITPIRSSIYPGSPTPRNYFFEIAPEDPRIKEIQSGVKNIHDRKCNTEGCDSYRILVFLSEKGKLLEKTPYISPDKLKKLSNYLTSNKLLYEPSPGWNFWYDHEFRGLLVEAEGQNKQSLSFIALTGEQVSNDHYPYYEFLFEFTNQESTPKLIASNRFFYDVSGFEGILIWQNLWIVFIGIGFILSIPITYYIFGNLDDSTDSTREQ